MKFSLSFFVLHVCVSFDETEPVDCVLTFSYGYNTLEYSWMKVTVVFMCLQILFMTLQNTKKLSSAIAGDRQLQYLQIQFVLVSFSFSLILPLPPLPME